MERVSFHLEAEISPTESEEKVKRAVENIFGNLETKIQPIHKGSLLTAESKGLEPLSKFYNLLRRERVRAAARKVFLEGLSRNSISFCLNKQVAYTGHISFSRETSESPLGPIKVKIESENPRRLIDWLTSRNI